MPQAFHSKCTSKCKKNPPFLSFIIDSRLLVLRKFPPQDITHTHSHTHYLIGLSFFERPILDHDAKAHNFEIWRISHEIQWISHEIWQISHEKPYKSNVSTKTL